MKKVLIVSNSFFPSVNIGSVRPSKIAKTLTRDGYCVDVFTRYEIDKDRDKYCNELYSFKSGTLLTIQQANGSQQTSSIKKAFSDNFSSFYKKLSRMKISFENYKKDREMLNAFKMFVKGNSQQYDAIFTTYGPLGNLLCGLYYKKKYPHIKWICDFRDPVVNETHGPVQRFSMRIIEQRACRSADEIVTVSNGYLTRICGDNYKEKRHMIPNGYDRDDMIYSKDIPEEKGCLQLSYVGLLYGSERDITPLFNAVKELIGSGEIDAAKIKINYAGTDAKNFYLQSRQFLPDESIVNHGILSREECLKMQFSSDILILSTWNTKKEYGVFPGKFLEYMLIGKPIVAIVAGDMPDSEVAQVMKEGKFGTVYEATNAQEDFLVLKEYIRQQYIHKINGEPLPFSPQKNVLERYNYDTVIKQIEAIIEK